MFVATIVTRRGSTKEVRLATAHSEKEAETKVKKLYPDLKRIVSIKDIHINEDVPTNHTSVNVAGTANDVTWKKIKSALWNRKKKMKTFKEFVELKEAAKYENYDANSSAHNIVKQLNKERNPRKKLATYHKDGSATFHAHGAYNSYHSYNVVDSILKHAGGNFNHSPEIYDNHKQTIKGHEYHSKKVNNFQHDIHVKKV